MRIGIVIGRIGGIDGVALETEKWIEVLERMGHEVLVLTGVLQRELKNVTLLPELDFHHPLTVRQQRDAFFYQKTTNNSLANRLERETAYIEKEILTWMVTNKIELLLPENACALPCHLTMGWALKNIIKKTQIPTITHDHDFCWERGDRYKSKFAFVKKLIKEAFPPHQSNIRHAVINSAAKDYLKTKFDMDSVVVPNVMDFEKPYAQRDLFNEDLPNQLGFKRTDILLFQITRIVRRKGIETAIELVKRLENPNIKLIITGGAIDDHNSAYYCELVDMVEDLKLNDHIFFGHEHFSTYRRLGKRQLIDFPEKKVEKLLKRHTGPKIYSLEDAYSFAQACTYFSTYEGFGNAFVEAVLAKKPIFVNNYKPVYMPDIGNKGFKTVMIEDGNLTDTAVDEIAQILKNSDLAQDIAEHNFELGRKYFSYEVLEEKLQNLIKSF
jgi:glycosyltransferase involved in cell wall biosynthesis